LSVTQKKKRVKIMHEAIGRPTLEVSTKGEVDLGVRLSAFNLKLDGKYLENVYQSSKVFTAGGPYRDLLEVVPKKAKRDERLQTSGELQYFEWEGERWDLSTGSAFYDYIYCRAVSQCIPTEELKALLDYEYFTDIEFNPNKGRNTQARSVAIVKWFLEMYGEVPALNKEDFLKMHGMVVRG